MIKSLDYINPGDSGLTSFNKKQFTHELQALIDKDVNTVYPLVYLKLLGLFLLEKFDDLKNILDEDPSLISSVEIKSLKILNQMILGKEVKESDIFSLGTKDLILRHKISKKISSSIVDLYQICIENICGFDIKFAAIDLLKLTSILPEIKFYLNKNILKQMILKSENHQIDFEGISEPERSFLEAVYYNATNQDQLYDQALLKYREQRGTLDLEKPTIFNSYGNANFYPPEAVLENWSEILKEADQVQKKILKLALLYENTCEYFHCFDCCLYTYPTMTLTEYKYLKEWMKENEYDEKKIIERSQKIQEDYKNLYGEYLQVLDKTKTENQIRGVENPHDFRFRCPFLEDGRCSCYEARPLVCRGFGLATDNNISIKACNYYRKQFQENASPDNERYSYDLRQVEMLAASSDRHLSGTGHLKGTIVAWFTRES